MRRKVVGAGPVATILDGNNAWSGPEGHVGLVRITKGTVTASALWLSWLVTWHGTVLVLKSFAVGLSQVHFLSSL